MIKAENINEKSPWQEMTIGGEIAEPGTSALTMTGQWRSMRPIWKPDACKQCLLCAPYCPDSSIPVKEEKRMDFDYDHCKGCGICYKVCPFSAIDFVKEGQA
ncbi:MAG: 4Fe-4S binding protein [Parasporobacterium sp.]|nr:4Fe-4S binding protein [Parasporobacterium sp.]